MQPTPRSPLFAILSIQFTSIPSAFQVLFAFSGEKKRNAISFISLHNPFPSETPCGLGRVCNGICMTFSAHLHEQVSLAILLFNLCLAFALHCTHAVGKQQVVPDLLNVTRKGCS